jgi:hypothetical protein
LGSAIQSSASFFAWKMQYALTLTLVPFEFHLPPIVILGWDGH